MHFYFCCSSKLQGASVSIMFEQPINFLSWNIRGLNCPDRRSTVNATIASSSCHVVCLPETKLDNIANSPQLFWVARGYVVLRKDRQTALGEESCCSGMIVLLRFPASRTQHTVFPP